MDTKTALKISNGSFAAYLAGRRAANQATATAMLRGVARLGYTAEVSGCVGMPRVAIRRNGMTVRSFSCKSADDLADSSRYDTAMLAYLAGAPDAWGNVVGK